jgi:hypothetical protein
LGRSSVPDGAFLDPPDGTAAVVTLNPDTDQAVIDRLFEHVDEFLAARRPA